jgi:hypothetical protein
MNDLYIPGSDTIPTIEAAWQTGWLTMQGDSYPENAHDLFSPLTDWMRRYLAQSERALMLELHLNYLNASSVKAMVDIFELLEFFHRKTGRITVKWFYDSSNERAADIAEKFREDCSFPFHILPFIR